MKLLKNRLGGRAAAESEEERSGMVRPNKKSALSMFVENFRKNNNSSRNSVVEDEMEMRLLNKGSYAQSDRTDPTDALTAISENLSVASEEISNALNKTFAVFRNPTSSTISELADANLEADTAKKEGHGEEEEEEGNFTNRKNTMLLNKASLDHMAELETASNFSNPKNRKLRVQSLTKKEAHTRSTEGGEGKEYNDGADSTLDASPSASSAASSFDPEQYLIALEARTSDSGEAVASLGDDYKEEGEVVLHTPEELVEVEVELQGSNSQSVDTVAGVASKEDDDNQVHSPLHSIAGGSTSSGSIGWENGSAQSLLDIALLQENALNKAHDYSSPMNEEIGSVEGPNTPHSTGSSTLEEYTEMEGLNAVADVFMNIVSCRFNDLAASMAVDDDDYSLADEDLPMFSNVCPMQGSRDLTVTANACLNKDNLDLPVMTDMCPDGVNETMNGMSTVCHELASDDLPVLPDVCPDEKNKAANSLKSVKGRAATPNPPAQTDFWAMLRCV